MRRWRTNVHFDEDVIDNKDSALLRSSDVKQSKLQRSQSLYFKDTFIKMIGLKKFFDSSLELEDEQPDQKLGTINSTKWSGT